MTEVEFHTGIADSVDFACRLLRKASRRGVRVLVTAPPEVLGQIDRQLWTFEEREFVPHVRVPGGPASVRARTPIWLAAGVEIAGDGAPGVVVNVGADAPRSQAGVERLIEIVAADADEAGRGRERWRAYKAAGLNIVHHAGSEARG